jgi:hypothetical protein
VRAELHSLDTADARHGALDAFVPEDSEHFGLAVTATIGPADGRGGEQFQFTVCSPSWLAAEDRPKGFAFQRTLLLDRWSAELVERAIADLCRHTEGETWQEVAQKLSRYAHWEFEDYREEA